MKNKKKKYWYYTEVYFCVLCGREDRFRSRKYTEKPPDPAHRIVHIQDACDYHFL